MEEKLPDGWVWVKIGEIANDVIGGSTPSRSQKRYFGGDIVWLTPTEIPKGTVSVVSDSKEKLTREGFDASSVRWVPAGSVLLTSRASIGYVAIAGTQVTTNQGFASFVLPEEVDPYYFGWWLKSQKNSLEVLARGTTFKEISKATLKEIFVPLAPTTEQHRIVAAIEQQFTRLDNAVASLQSAKTRIKQYRASLLKAAVEGELTKEWRAEHSAEETGEQLLAHILAERRVRWEEEQLAKMREQGITPKNDTWKQRYEEPQRPDVAELATLPDGWCWATMEQLASPEPRSIQSGPFGSSLLHSEFQKVGVLAIGIDNVLDGSFSMGNQHRISPEKYEQLKKYTARPLDVLITVMATVGRCCVVPADLETAIITKHVYRITTNQKIISPQFLMLCLCGGSEVRRQLFTQVQGQTRPGINGEILRRIAIPVPSLSEQEQIVAEVESRMSNIAKMEETIEASLKRAEHERQSILREAFAGRLVPQNPEDEPASVLLKRFQEQRKTQILPKREERKKRSIIEIQREIARQFRAKIIAANRKYLGLYGRLIEANRALVLNDLFKQVIAILDERIDAVEAFYEELDDAERQKLLELEVKDRERIVVRALKPSAEIVIQTEREENLSLTSNRANNSDGVGKPSLWDR